MKRLAGLVAALTLAMAWGVPAAAQPDPAKLSALEAAYKAGAITREQYEAKKRELMGGAGPAPNAGGGGTRAPAGPATAPGGVVRHDDPDGFTVSHPRGWSVEKTPSRGVIVRSPDRVSFALIQPVFARADARSLLGGLAFPGREAFGQAKVMGVSQLRPRPDEATAVVRYGGAGEGRATLLASMIGDSGMVFGIAAPAAQYERQRPVLVDIVRSFSFARSQAGSTAAPEPPPQLRYVRWQDPLEGAFSIEVPHGWRVEGGTRRRSAVEPRHFVRATSPDGVTVGFGDPTIPTFAVPNDSLTFAGFREGSWYSPTGAATFMVMRYYTGSQYAEGYLRSTLSRGLSDVQVRDQRDRQDLAALANQNHARYDTGGFQTRATSGEVSFTARANGRPVAGYCLATTEVTSGMGIAQWTVQGPAYHIAPIEQVPAATAALARMFQTVQLNPEWVRMQQGTTAAVADITARTGQQISNIISQSYWSRQQALDRTNRNFSDTIRGVQRVKHPDTGQEYEAVAGSNYYYLPRGGDRPFGTDSTEVPKHIDVTPLLKVQ